MKKNGQVREDTMLTAHALAKELRKRGYAVTVEKIREWYRLNKIRGITGIGFVHPRFRIDMFMQDYDRNLAPRNLNSVLSRKTRATAI